MILQAALDHDGGLHMFFTPVRYNGDISPLAYLGQDNQGGALVRRIVDRGSEIWGGAALVSPDGHPGIVYYRPEPGGSWHLVEARWTGEKWVHSSLPIREPVGFRSVACDKHGKLWFAAMRGQQFFLFSKTGDAGKREPVWEHKVTEEYQPNDMAFQAATLVDALDRPVLVLACRSQRHNWLRVFRLK
jgi:hypothetical protein